MQSTSLETTKSSNKSSKLSWTLSKTFLNDIYTNSSNYLSWKLTYKWGNPTSSQVSNSNGALIVIYYGSYNIVYIQCSGLTCL